jgi:hypothetical protein
MKWVISVDWESLLLFTIEVARVRAFNDIMYFGAVETAR